ncbi:hypothetical protein JW948_18235 [bacterium]|nr:hypothetical protein [bacterium]
MNLQQLVDQHSFIANVLSILDRYGGLIMLCAFGILMIVIFYWIIVIAPRRVKQVYAGLLKKGYQTADPASRDIGQVIKTLSPVYPIRPLKDQPVPDWSVDLAVRMPAVNGSTRYVIHVRRSQVDRLSPRPASSLRKTDLILEKVSLKFTEPLFIVPIRNRCDVLWEWRYQLKKTTAGLDEAFLKKYHVYSRSGTADYFPVALRDALLHICPILCDTSKFCLQGGVTLKFQKDGWGLCPAHEIYKSSDMETLLRAAEAVSGAIS